MANLSGENQHRQGVKVCPENTGNGIRSAGSRSHAKHCRYIVDSAVALCRHRARLLMMLIQGLHLFLMSKRIVQVHRPAAYHGKGTTNACLHKPVCNVVRHSFFHFSNPFSLRISYGDFYNNW